MHNQKKNNKFKTNKKNQNWQKIKLYGSLITKELKKKHSFIPVEGGKRWAAGVERMHSKSADGECKVDAGGPGRARQRLAEGPVPHLYANKLGGTTVERDRPHNPGFQHGEIKPQSSY